MFRKYLLKERITLKDVEERNITNEETENLSKNLAELNEEEITQITGGDGHGGNTEFYCENPNCLYLLQRGKRYHRNENDVKGLQYHCYWCNSVLKRGQRIY